MKSVLLSPVNPCIQRADDRHGPDAEKQRRRHKAFSDGHRAVGRFFKPLPNELPESVQPLVQIEGRSDDRPEHDCPDEDEGVFTFEGAGNADVERAEDRCRIITRVGQFFWGYRF